MQTRKKTVSPARPEQTTDAFEHYNNSVQMTTDRHHARILQQEVAMPETKRMAEEANRIGQEAQEQAKQVGQEFQRAAERGFEAASRSFAEINRNFQAIATEMTDFSKRRLDDVLQSWEQLLRARSFPDVVEVQTRYAQKAYDAYMSEFSKLGEMYLGTARDAAKPIEQTSRKFS